MNFKATISISLDERQVNDLLVSTQKYFPETVNSNMRVAQAKNLFKRNLDHYIKGMECDIAERVLEAIFYGFYNH